MESSRPESGAEPEERIAALINQYFVRRQAGEDITPAAFAAEHPERAEELKPYLEGMSILGGMSTAGGAHVAWTESVTGDLALPTIAGFVLQEEIGHGGMGVVYKALQVSTKRIVALKVTLAGSFAGKSVRRRFKREVELAARLQHPNIVRVLESGRVERQRYYAMDYVQGVPLDRYLQAERCDLRTVLRIFMRLCGAVHYAHTEGVIHRDLKPANVLIDDAGEPNILDFGLARAVDPTEMDMSVITRATAPGQIVGTLPYLSPEQAAPASGEVDARTDVYALGVMLYEALTGSMPYDVTGDASDVMRRIEEDLPAPPSSLRRRVGGDLDAIVLKALEKEKDRRYPSAEELGEDLRRCIEGEPILARRPSTLYLLRKKLRKHRVAAIVGLLLVIAAVVVVVAAWGESRRRQRELAEARASAVQHQHALEGAGRAEERAVVIGAADALYERYPELPEVRLIYAQARYRTEVTREGAIMFLEKAVRPVPLEWAARLLLADMLETAGDVQRAETLRAEAEAIMPDTAEAWYVRSFATLDLQDALRCAEEAVARRPAHVLAWLRMAWLRVDTGDLDGALQAADRLIALGEKPGEYAGFKARVLASQGRFEEALEEFRRTGSYRDSAHIYHRTGQYEKAVAEYTRLIESRSGAVYGWDHYQRATPLWILGRREEAAEDYRRARVLLGRPTYGDARRFLILCELGRQHKAGEVLVAALRDVEVPWLARILRCLAGEVAPEELVALAEGLDNPEQLCEAYYYAGEVCLLAGRRDEARTFFAQCVDTGLDMDPDAGFGTPMNEFALAKWRLASRFAPPAGPTTKGN